MGHRFELPLESTVEATPEEVWQAISTGPGIDSWFMGRNDVSGGAVHTAFGGVDFPASTVTAGEPGRRFAHTSEPQADGRFVAYEFLIEGRERGSTAVRMVTSGFLPGDDWENEFEAMSSGLPMFFATLVEYLTHFPGRTAAPLTEFGPPITDWPRAWETLYGELGLSPDKRPASPGDLVRFSPGGVGVIEGVVYHANAQTIGIRTGDALYRFLQGFHGPMIAAHHLFGADPGDQGPAWHAWLSTLFTDHT
ncbi:SRPBCC domain-containing protein [Nonomuraea sp. NN258]|uniref:SRPBCC family protein n=1 Tax=Nonomuraea antri TaxID=2730852 RepID=UPI001568AEF4|nr:SRPBCC domain-containing protein [Nonomuraea antri]NRQ36128.1 SRPBCC domain-containing protein [Nonomuraea antri]